MEARTLKLGVSLPYGWAVACLLEPSSAVSQGKREQAARFEDKLGLGPGAPQSKH